MAGAVGMEVISPMPMAPPATFQAGLLHHNGLNFRRDLVGTEQTQHTVFGGRLAVYVDRILLRERIAQTHDHTTLDLSLTAEGVHGLTYIDGGHHLLDTARSPGPEYTSAWHSRRPHG